MDQSALIKEAKLAVIGHVCGITALPEDELLHRLEELYWEGFKAGNTFGKAQVEPILKSVVSEVAAVIAAHMKGDALAVKAALDKFVKDHVVVSPTTPQQTH